MVLGHAQCQMAFYVQQKAFEVLRLRGNQPGPDPNRPANVSRPSAVPSARSSRPLTCSPIDIACLPIG